MSRPRRVVVNFGGIDYDMDLKVCRLALVRRRVAGEFDSMEALAEAIGHCRSTASRYFSGRNTSLAVALAVLDKLKLGFDDVYTLRDTGDGASSPPGQPVSATDR